MKNNLKDYNSAKISNNIERNKNNLNNNYNKKPFTSKNIFTQDEPGNISEAPSSFEDFLRENASFEDMNINDAFFKTKAKVNLNEESKKTAETSIKEDDERRGIEIIIPLISEDKNLYPLFRLIFILLIVASIAMFGIKSVHFDGYKEFTSEENYTLEDAHKLFLEGKYIDSYNCYSLNNPQYKLPFYHDDYYKAAKSMVKIKWNDSKQRIFIKFPELPFSSFFEKLKGSNRSEHHRHEVPAWVIAELYEAAESYFNNKTSDNYYSDEIEIASIYEICSGYKDSDEKYNKYKTLIRYSTKNGL